MKTQILTLGALVCFLFQVIPCQASLIPYVDSLSRADGIAIVTVVSVTEELRGDLIHKIATLRVDTAIKGIKANEMICEEFGVPEKPEQWDESGTIVRMRGITVVSDSLSFEIGRRYVALLAHKGDKWKVTRESPIYGNAIADGDFNHFARSARSAQSDWVSLPKAIELLNAHETNKESNRAKIRQNIKIDDAHRWFEFVVCSTYLISDNSPYRLKQVLENGDVELTEYPAPETGAKVILVKPCPEKVEADEPSPTIIVIASDYRRQVATICELRPTSSKTPVEGAPEHTDARTQSKSK